jgi:hypothetical protein
MSIYNIEYSDPDRTLPPVIGLFKFIHTRRHTTTYQLTTQDLAVRHRYRYRWSGLWVLAVAFGLMCRVCVCGGSSSWYRTVPYYVGSGRVALSTFLNDFKPNDSLEPKSQQITTKRQARSFRSLVLVTADSLRRFTQTVQP